MMKYIKFLIILYLSVLSAACALIYEQNIQQGNIVTDEMLDKLEVGMSQAVVKYHLGTPLVEDPFHINRWDYYYAFHEGGDEHREQKIITLIFNETGSLADIRGGTEVVVTDASQVDLPDKGKLNTIKTKEESRGLWANLKAKALGQ